MAQETADVKPFALDIVGEVGVNPAVLDEYRDTPLTEAFPGALNSSAYHIGEYVLKIGKQTLLYHDAQERAKTMAEERELQRVYLDPNHTGEHLLPSTIWTIPVGEPWHETRICILQPFAPGVTLRKYLADPAADTTHIQHLLQRSLVMYSETGQIPDLANIQNRFRVEKTKNLVIAENGRTTLVDDTFGKAQRSEHTGAFFSAHIARGVERALKKLEERQPFLEQL